MAKATHGPEAFPETPAGMLSDHVVQLSDDIGITVGCFLWGFIEGCPRQANATTAPLH
jgi:hypothetical protein